MKYAQINDVDKYGSNILRQFKINYRTRMSQHEYHPVLCKHSIKVMKRELKDCLDFLEVEKKSKLFVE